MTVEEDRNNAIVEALSDEYWENYKDLVKAIPTLADHHRSALAVVSALAGRIQGLITMIVELHPEMEIPLGLVVRRVTENKSASTEEKAP